MFRPNYLFRFYALKRGHTATKHETSDNWNHTRERVLNTFDASASLTEHCCLNFNAG